MQEQVWSAARRWAAGMAMLALAFAAAWAGRAAAAEKNLVDFNAAGAIDKVEKNGVQAAIVSNGVTNVLEVTCAPGEANYPGVTIKAPEGGWDLSQCGRVEAVIVNNGEAPVHATLRLDNDGDWRQNPWNGEAAYVQPGKSATVSVTFGYSFGKPGFKLDSSKVIKAMVFTGKPKQTLKYRIESLRAAGAPGDKPRGMTEKVRPANGAMFAAGETVEDARLSGFADGKCTVSAAGAAFALPAPGKDGKAPAASLAAKIGEIWDMSLCSEVTLSLKNAGAAAAKITCRLDNNNCDGKSGCALATAEIPAGAAKDVTIPFVTDKVWNGERGSGFAFGSDDVRKITLLNAGDAAATVLLTAANGAGKRGDVPEWLGKRPPVPGDWKITFEDNFDGKAIDRKKWVPPADDIADPNDDGNCNRCTISIWDSMSLNTVDNLLAGDGHMTLRVTKMQNPQAEAQKMAEKLFKGKIGEKADEVAKMKQRRYLSTVVTTFDRFAQKYGYFEARMKLADGLGMWPAFWLMPDRGKEAGIWWKRNATENGGMEFDIMEQLGRYGPYRYNVAMHWDGYGKNHKATGTENVYFLPDKDGYVTSGLLWEPGRARFYVQGRLVADWQNERVGSVPMYVMFTQPLGGWGTNGVVEDAKLPFDFKVDYVRVWQRDDLAGK